MAKTLHPALKAHGLKVKAAHATLSATIPGFRMKPPHEQFKAVQLHIKRGGCS